MSSKQGLSFTTVVKYTVGSYLGYALAKKIMSGDPNEKVKLPAIRKDSPICLIVGCGVSGMCMSIKLAEKGIEHVVIEKEHDVGGTWLLSNYPGVSSAHDFSFDRHY
jgi:heterodisulfide reductase subunit A-like polyferredoxin